MSERTDVRMGMDDFDVKLIEVFKNPVECQIV